MQISLATKQIKLTQAPLKLLNSERSKTQSRSMEILTPFFYFGNSSINFAPETRQKRKKESSAKDVVTDRARKARLLQ